jgi:hypothetical protein
MKAYIVLLLSCVVLAGAVSSCGFFSPEPPPSAKSVPLYPGAKAVKVDHPGGVTTLERASFRTSDSPADVLAYYRDLLESDSWEYEVDLSTSSKLYYAWGVQNNAMTNVYELTVSVEAVSAVQTNVEVRVATYLPK